MRSSCGVCDAATQSLYSSSGNICSLTLGLCPRPRSFRPFRAPGRDGRRRARLGRWLLFSRASSVRRIVPRSHRTNSCSPRSESRLSAVRLERLENPSNSFASNHKFLHSLLEGQWSGWSNSLHALHVTPRGDGGECIHSQGFTLFLHALRHPCSPDTRPSRSVHGSLSVLLPD